MNHNDVSTGSSSDIQSYDFFFVCVSWKTKQLVQSITMSNDLFNIEKEIWNRISSSNQYAAKHHFYND